MFKLLRYLRPYSIPVAAVLVLIFGQCMADLYLPTLMSDIVNKGITNGDVSYIIATGARMLLVALGGSACAILAGYLSSHSSMGLGEILREKIYTHVSRFSLHEIDKLGTPSLVTRSTNDVTQVQMFALIMMRMIISAPIMATGGIILAVVAALLLIALIMIPVALEVFK